MTELSPAAQAVYNAYSSHWTADPYEVSPEALAAALRAVADRVIPAPHLPYDSCCDVHAAAIRADFLALAAELEAQWQ